MYKAYIIRNKFNFNEISHPKVVAYNLYPHAVLLTQFSILNTLPKWCPWTPFGVHVLGVQKAAPNAGGAQRFSVQHGMRKPDANYLHK